MKLMLYTYSLPPKIDGVTFRIMMWLDTFKKYYPDDEIVLVTPRKDTEKTINGYPVYRLISKPLPTYFSINKQEDVHVQRMTYYNENYEIMSSIIEKHNIEYVYVTGIEFVYPFKLLKSKHPYLKMIYGFHTNGEEYVEKLFYKTLGVKLVAQTYAKVMRHIHNFSGISVFDKITVMSNINRDYIENKMKYEHQTIEQIPPVIDNNLFTYKHHDSIKDTIKLLYVGRISGEKNIDTMVKTLQKYWNPNYCSLELTLVGDGPIRSKLEKECQLQNNLKFNFIGFQSRESLPNYYHTHDIFVFPSTTETLGFVTIEAMSCGIPIIASAAGGTLSLIENNKDGILLDEYELNSNKLIKSIIELKVNDSYRLDLIKNAYEKTKNWNMRNNVDFLKSNVFNF